jgi:hypothetical protein
MLGKFFLPLFPSLRQGCTGRSERENRQRFTLVPGTQKALERLAFIIIAVVTTEQVPDDATPFHSYRVTS